jgi:type IV secretory pathway TrbD component
MFLNWIPAFAGMTLWILENLSFVIPAKAGIQRNFGF